MRRIYRRPKPDNTNKKFLVNEQIRASEVVLIDEEGNHRGLVKLEEALKLAQEAELDLVEVNPIANPPICKILDYGQFKYERDKKSQKQKAAQKKTDTKTLRLSLRIGDHDFKIRLEQAKKFLSRGDKLKIELLLKGRERQHSELGRDVIVRFVNDLKADENFWIVEEEPLTKAGAKFNMLLVNKKS